MWRSQPDQSGVVGQKCSFAHPIITNPLNASTGSVANGVWERRLPSLQLTHLKSRRPHRPITMPNFEIEDKHQQPSSEQQSFAAKRARKNGKTGRGLLLLLAWISGAIAAVVAANVIIQRVKSNENNRPALTDPSPSDSADQLDFEP